MINNFDWAPICNNTGTITYYEDQLDDTDIKNLIVRTNCTYSIAKDAIIKHHGNYMKALIDIVEIKNPIKFIMNKTHCSHGLAVQALKDNAYNIPDAIDWLIERDVQLIVAQANVTPEAARQALRETNGDIVNAIMLL
jgi:NACalpha-BTF3-like transcription factor